MHRYHSSGALSPKCGIKWTVRYCSARGYVHRISHGYSSLFTYMYIHIHTYIIIIIIKYKKALDLHTYIHTYIHTHTRWAISGKQSIGSGAWVRLRVGWHVYAGATWSNMRCFVGMYVCMYICMYVCIYACMYVWLYAY